LHWPGGQGPPEVSAIPINPANALCLDFVNSEFADHTGTGRTFDRLPLADWWRWLASRWELSLPDRMSSADLRKLQRLRARLRSSLQRAARRGSLGASELRWANRCLGESPRRLLVPVGAPDARIRLSPLSNDWAAITAECVLSFVALVKEGNPRRIRECANESCSWMFYDDSRNLSRRWCDPRFCGNLIKVRRHRAVNRRASN
jgi:predicted RNA-binding Zn ribbon-like protein